MSAAPDLIAAAGAGIRVMSVEEWTAEGIRRFGHNSADWEFVCPSCGRTQTGADFVRIGAAFENAFTNCLGRLTNDGQCSYTAAPGTAYGRQQVTTLHGVIVEVAGVLRLIFPFAGGAR